MKGKELLVEKFILRSRRLISIKRHPALQPLSRDHVIALYHAHQLIWLSEGHARHDAVTTVGNFREAWVAEVFPHFKNEEHLLPPLPVSATSIERLLTEHRLLVDLIMQLDKQEQPDIDLCKKLGQALVDHIRWEEHELFPEVERSLSPAELDKLQEQTRLIDIARKHSE